MKTIDLEGDRVPALGLGTWRMSGLECRAAVADALRIGYRHIDTAQMYGNEKDIGQALAVTGIARDELFIASKVWWDNLRYEDTLRSTDASLRDLGTDYLDLMLIHWPNPELPLAEPLRALERLRAGGRVRHIGVSNFTPALLRAALRVAPVACVQVEYHPFLDQSALLQICRKEGLMLTAYAPLARGEVGDETVLGEIGRRHGRSAAQVALRWLMQQDRVAAIPKAARAEHRRENFAIFDFELDENEMARIGALERGERLVDPAIAPAWNR